MIRTSYIFFLSKEAIDLKAAIKTYLSIYANYINFTVVCVVCGRLLRLENNVFIYVLENNIFKFQPLFLPDCLKQFKDIYIDHNVILVLKH